MSTALAYHPLCELHESPVPHPECPDRVRVTLTHLEGIGLLHHKRVQPVTPEPCTLQRLCYAHDKGYVNEMMRTLTDVTEPDTQGDIFFNEHTREACLLAAGAAVDVATRVIQGKCKNGMTIVRPPGHHADAKNPSGFCFFNNAAVAAKTLQREYGVKKVVIFDWDVHHGDGTEKIFYNDPSVLCVSLHQYAHGMPQKLFTQPPPPATAPATPNHKDDVEEEMGVDDLAAMLGEPEGEEDPTSRPTRKRVRSEEATQQQQQSSIVSEKEARDFFRNLGYIEAGDDDDDDDDESYDPEGDSEDSTTNSLNSGEYNSNVSSFYPGTGAKDIIGAGPGEGYNLNIPWPSHNFGDLEYVYLTEKVCIPIIQEFQPDIIFIAAGFDAVRGDTLGSMGLTPSGYARMTQLLMDCTPHGRVVATLEGGYNTTAVALCVESVVRTLLGGDAVGPSSKVLMHRAQRLVGDLQEIMRPHWRCFGAANHEQDGEGMTATRISMVPTELETPLPQRRSQGRVRNSITTGTNELRFGEEEQPYGVYLGRISVTPRRST
eukprot:PhF_6_TR41688/c0_g1_i2/m.63234